METIVMIMIGAGIGWLIGRIIVVAYTKRQLRKSAKPIYQDNDIKRVIEQSLPKLPIGCMWKVEKVNKTYAYVIREKGDPFNSLIGHYPHIVWDDTPEWDIANKSRHTGEALFARFILEDPNGECGQVDIQLDEDDSDFLDTLKRRIKSKCIRLVNEYNKKSVQWDGIYLPGVSNE